MVEPRGVAIVDQDRNLGNTSNDYISPWFLKHRRVTIILDFKTHLICLEGYRRAMCS